MHEVDIVQRAASAALVYCGYPHFCWRCLKLRSSISVSLYRALCHHLNRRVQPHSRCSLVARNVHNQVNAQDDSG
ncbi:hypothetical protein V5799_010220 [Amblyomma americanum]|uniref:Uncharacterized protein n=1 Tax=Amblyomma americanum TaxID=6943 RepID=A0AAQ4F894_AMBAM